MLRRKLRSAVEYAAAYADRTADMGEA